MGERETADEAFYERNMLALLYARGYYWHDGWKVLVIDSPAGQLTYHVPKYFETYHLPLIDPCWDGHTTEEKHRRIRDHMEDMAAQIQQENDDYQRGKEMNWNIPEDRL